MRLFTVSILLGYFYLAVLYIPFAFSSAGGPTCATNEGEITLAIGERCGDTVYVGTISGEHLYTEAIARKEKLTWVAATVTCADLGSGWRVPSRSELKLLFHSRHAGPLAGTLDSGWYWSSTRATSLSTPWVLGSGPIDWLDASAPV